MKTIRIVSLFALTIVSGLSLIHAGDAPKNPKPFRGSARYNAIHVATTLGSFVGGGVVTAAGAFVFGMMWGPEAFPWLRRIPSFVGVPILIGMRYSGLVAGACLVGATPYLTNQGLHKCGYLTKEEAAYTNKQMAVHVGARLLTLALLCKYGNTSINGTKRVIFNMRNK